MNAKMKKFLSAINKQLKVAKVVEYKTGSEAPNMLHFDLKFISSKYFNESTYLNKTDAYFQLIENTVLEFYNDVPNFNNTGDTFWFYDQSVK